LNGEDPDVDGDGLLNENDPDVDGDGLLNENDPDIDGDGIPNSTDDTPNGVSSADQRASSGSDSATVDETSVPYSIYTGAGTGAVSSDTSAADVKIYNPFAAITEEEEEQSGTGTTVIYDPGTAKSGSSSGVYVNPSQVEPQAGGTPYIYIP
jgi:hypothetical protein